MRIKTKFAFDFVKILHFGPRLFEFDTTGQDGVFVLLVYFSGVDNLCRVWLHKASLSDLGPHSVACQKQ